MSDSPVLGAPDPDDLAAMVCAALRMRGCHPSVTFRIDEGRIIAIEVALEGRRIARFSCQPFMLNEAGRDRIAKEIENR